MSAQADDDLFISAITLAEIRRGVSERPAGRKRRTAVWNRHAAHIAANKGMTLEEVETRSMQDSARPVRHARRAGRHGGFPRLFRLILHDGTGSDGGWRPRERSLALCLPTSISDKIDDEARPQWAER